MYKFIGRLLFDHPLVQKVGLTNGMRRIKARCKIRLFYRLQAADDKRFPNKVILITPRIVRAGTQSGTGN